MRWFDSSREESVGSVPQVPAGGMGALRPNLHGFKSKVLLGGRVMVGLVPPDRPEVLCFVLTT